MNKIVLKPTRPRINLKNIKPKVNTMENTNHKVHISSRNACDAILCTIKFVINLCVKVNSPLLFHSKPIIISSKACSQSTFYSLEVAR